MSESKPLYRTILPNGMEVAYIDKGMKNPLGLTREMYEKAGYQPVFDDLPPKWGGPTASGCIGSGQ